MQIYPNIGLWFIVSAIPIAYAIYKGSKDGHLITLKNTYTLALIAIFAALANVLHLFRIPLPIGHIGIHNFPIFLLAITHGPIVGILIGALAKLDTLILYGNPFSWVFGIYYGVFAGLTILFFKKYRKGIPFLAVMVGSWGANLTYNFLRGSIVGYTWDYSLIKAWSYMPEYIIQGLIVEVLMATPSIRNRISRSSPLNKGD